MLRSHSCPDTGCGPAKLPGEVAWAPGRIGEPEGVEAGGRVCGCGPAAGGRQHTSAASLWRHVGQVPMSSSTLGSSSANVSAGESTCLWRGADISGLMR